MAEKVWRGTFMHYEFGFFDSADICTTCSDHMRPTRVGEIHA
jgi:hypothetical protein